MCGIAGTLGLVRRDARRDAAVMNAALALRGPDDCGAIVEPPVMLAHRRLAIIDVSANGHQPMTDASQRFAMVYNGEIYNHRELRTERLRGCAFRGGSDSETLLELFARYGTDAFALLNGIFAVAIWDRKEQTLVIGRDGMGVKPLYLWRPPGGGLGIASELKALQALDGFSAELDCTAAAAYVTYLYSPGERTMFRTVRKHPAGVWTRYDAAGREAGSGCFFALPDYRPRTMSAAEAVSTTYRELGDAVERQMLADVEVGAFLSGGLDSTAIVHFAERHSPERLRCFTIRYGDDGSTRGEMVADLPFAREAAAHLGVELHEVPIDPGLARDLPLLVDMLDEPQADPAALGNFFISRAASELGLKILLGGAGGDDMLTGYRRHLVAAHDAKIGLVPSALRSGLARMALRIPSDSHMVRRLRKALVSGVGSADERLLTAFEWLPAEAASDLLCEPVGGDAVRQPFASYLDDLEANAVERMLRLEQRFFLRDHNLNYTDKTGMSASVEIRVPFLDLQFVKFASHLPTEFKLRSGVTKWALRKAMEPHLPRNVIYRPKTGFGVPLRSWLAGPMGETIADLTSRETLDSRGLFDGRAVAALRDDHFAGRIDAAYPLLAVAMIELWCRRFAS
ncbi:asparagine synthase (glutamine-hydrolyzing) [Tsuneonella troitsensis]|uniref:asparagine synthase (glutamine-hydrolyzing) n=1 Tax=Tsuneonella troitsensis TaxID=292222 RepID=UPI000709293B|nr:asparagine synthase (glutamine-hydrolyzing) [Tsuneonella troitsensis]